MKYDVFISYSSSDQKVVEALSHYLEENKVRCFIAYRDIPKGQPWPPAIPQAITDSQIMVVVLSENFNLSTEVDREITICSKKKKSILIYRIEETDLQGTKEYYLTDLNWIDSFPNPESNFRELLDSVCKLINTDGNVIGNNLELQPKKVIISDSAEVELYHNFDDVKGNDVKGNDVMSMDIESKDKNEQVDNLDAKVFTAEEYADMGCPKFLIIPDNFTSIGEGAFKNCEHLISVVIPESINRIGKYTFSKCVNLSEVSIPNSVTSIDDYAFSSCQRLISIVIPNSVLAIGNYAFSNCQNISSITIPNSVTLIGEEAFSCCYNLTSVIMLDSVISIEVGAFRNCSNLYEIEIPNSVVSIGECAFQDCKLLSWITLHRTIVYIGDNAFNGCSDNCIIRVPKNADSVKLLIKIINMSSTTTIKEYYDKEASELLSFVDNMCNKIKKNLNSVFALED